MNIKTFGFLDEYNLLNITGGKGGYFRIGPNEWRYFPSLQEYLKLRDNPVQYRLDNCEKILVKL